MEADLEAVFDGVEVVVPDLEAVIV